MIDHRLQKLIIWIKARDARERLLLVAMLMVFVYVAWNFLIDSPIFAAQKELQKQITATKSEIKAFHAQKEAVSNIVTTHSFLEKMAQLSKLAQQSENFKQQITSVLTNSVSPANLPHLITDILSEQENITLISLKNLPVERWISGNLGAMETLPNVKNIYKYGLEIEFRSNYFNAIAYLNRLERLPWHLYWDSLDYKVLQYPEADVVAKIYVLSNQAS